MQKLYITNEKRTANELTNSKRVNEHCRDIKKHPSNHSVISNHRSTYGHDFNWKEPKILHVEKHRKKREIAEMFFIKKIQQQY